MTISREFKELLLAKIDLVDLVRTYNVPLQQKSANNYFARCPFHDEKSPSFSVSQTKQFYYCFGCGAHGNAIDFVMQQDRLSFPEAMRALARLAGMEVPENNEKSSKKKNALDASLYAFMEQLAAHYYEQMRQSQPAIQYLKHRGISGSIAQQFHIGYASPRWDQLLDIFGKTESGKKKLMDTGMIIKKNEGGHYDRFRDRIMFPIHDYRGRIIGFGGRVIAQGEPKYLNSPETLLFQKGHELYGLYQALKAHRTLDQVIVVEGYMDVIALFQQGITYAVATLGTATSTHHLQRLFRYTAKIIFCFDGDQAGKNAAWRALQTALPHLQDQLQIRFLFLPDGEDPDSLVRQEGKAAFEQRMQTATSLSDFFFQTIHQSCDTHSMEGRARLTALALSYIKLVPPGIFQTLLLDELSKRARVDKNELRGQIMQTKSHVSSPYPIEPAPATPDIKLALPLKMAMALLIQHPYLVSHITHPLPESQLPGYAFFIQLIDIINKNINLTTGMLVEYWRGQKEEKFVLKLAHLEHAIPEAGLISEFIGSLRQIILLTHDETINSLMKKAAQQMLSADEKQTLSAWISKKKALIVQL